MTRDEALQHIRDYLDCKEREPRATIYNSDHLDLAWVSEQDNVHLRWSHLYALFGP